MDQYLGRYLEGNDERETRDNIIVSHFSLSLSFYFHEKSSLFICSTGGRRILFSLGNVSMTRKMVRSLLLVISGVAQSLLFLFFFFFNGYSRWKDEAY